MKQLSWKHFGYHVVYDKDIFEAIDFASKHGFGYIVPDLMIPRFFPERFNPSERSRIAVIAASKDVSISFHGPSDYMNLGALYPEVRQAVLERMKLCIDFARDVRAERLTIHVEPPFDFVFAGGEGTFLKDHWMMYKDALKQSLIELSEYTRKDVSLCVENHRLGKMAIEALEELLPEEKLFLTWDIPKGYGTDGNSIAEVEDLLMHHLDRVRECHLHDQKVGKPSHDLLGAGKLDFSRYLKMLLPQDIHFTLEIRPRDEALESLKTLKKMLANLGWKISART